jgi:hypothetical protein
MAAHRWVIRHAILVAPVREFTLVAHKFDEPVVIVQIVQDPDLDPVWRLVEWDRFLQVCEEFRALAGHDAASRVQLGEGREVAMNQR